MNNYERIKYNNPFADNDVFNFLKGFQVKETKEEITNKYIQGLITKEEFLERMKKACE